MSGARLRRIGLGAAIVALVSCGVLLAPSCAREPAWKVYELDAGAGDRPGALRASGARLRAGEDERRSIAICATCHR